MRSLAATLTVALIVAFLASPAAAVESDPSLEELGPVGVWVDMEHGIGTDSRDRLPANAPQSVRWSFALKRAPVDTEFRLWAEFENAGEIQVVGVDTASITTPGHDVLVNAYGHCILPSLGEGDPVTLELRVVEPLASPSSADSNDDQKRPGSTEQEFLPYTGAPGIVPAAAALFAALGLALRRYSN